MRTTTTADKFRISVGQLVWHRGAIVKLGYITSTYDYVALVDPDGDVYMGYASDLRVYHPETGVKASDFAYDAEEVLV